MLLAMEQSKGTEKTAAALMHLLNYAATHPEAKIRYYASDMILYIDSDASYLSLPLGKSRSRGFFYFSKRQTKPKEKPTSLTPLNGAVYVLCTRLKHVMASAAEAEVGSLFMNCQEAIPIRTACEEMGHPQPPTPVKTDNSTASGLANATIKQRKSRSMDMRFYWHLTTRK